MVRTRFAPSPTGYLHIGGVRTALFNWLLARQSGGQFILRIDDTDQQRNVMAALQPILDGFRWLGLDWDEGPDVGGPHAPYFQSQRVDRHVAAVEKLLASGHAYRDFAKPEELDAQRKAAEQAGKTFVYDRRWAAENDSDVERFKAEGRTGVVRLKTPREGQCRFHDLVLGDVVVEWANEQDHVIQRADGTCLYHLASVVDDFDLEITHVVRAAEHLANTPRQILIAQSLGYALPIYAHLPVVAEPGGTAKLSKRKLDKYLKNRDFAELLATGNRIAQRIGHATSADTFNPVIVDFYEVIGFTPDALLNYLLLLGWSLDGTTERFTREEMIRSFTLERVNKSPASFDPQKLQSFQASRMAEMSVDAKVALVTPYLEKAGWLNTAADQLKVPRVVAGLGDRLRISGDILDYDYCFLGADKIRYDAAAVKKRLTDDPQAKQRLDTLTGWFTAAPEFSTASLHDFVNEQCKSQGIKLGEIIHALRVSTTGQSVGFGMFETLEVLGREEVLARLAHAKSTFLTA